ncbi:hypothetical protein KVV02_000234 [Mortierella alpina]|uniref:Kelch repeat protein n=1 Tax=Mortierella alpina TaxID=64518 RepID=A0A9P8D3F4_MORAP|nr:hypothetical protein KVV02_000234 [Mortierella alpina]
MAALAVNYDKKSLLYFNSHRTPSVYNITTRTWQLGTRLTNPNATTVLPKSIYSNQVATDPSSGIAYIPSVEHFDNFPMFTYNTSQGYTPNVTKTIVPGVSIPYDKYGAIWSTVRKSILFYGGEINGFTPVGLMEYQPSSNQWTGVKTQGATTPGNLSLPCIASAYSGMKMVMFGNYERPYSVFILDVKTLVWTKGADPRPGEERNAAACTVVGDYFIVAGGSPSLGGGVLQPVIVYNIKMNQWTDSYEAPNTPSVSTSGGNSPTTETSLPVADKEQRSGEGMNSGTRIGIIAGGSSILLILLTCGAFLIHRQKKRMSRQAAVSDKNVQKSNLENMEEDQSSATAITTDNDNKLDTDETGDDIQLRGILASIDYLTHRPDQQHVN